jgi:hypothetical protein
MVSMVMAIIGRVPMTMVVRRVILSPPLEPVA